MEIGSIFEINPQNLFANQDKDIPLLPVQKRLNYSVSFFNTGRAAIEMLLKELKKNGKKKVLLPAFLCDSVRNSVLRAELEISYYRINTDLSIDVNTIQFDTSCILYVVQFFGQRLNNEALAFIKQFHDAGGTVVEDISLSLLSDDEGYVGFGD